MAIASVTAESFVKRDVEAQRALTVERRAQPRYRTGLPTSCRRIGLRRGKAHPARIRDYSAGGICLEVPFRLEVGDRVEVPIDGEALPGVAAAKRLSLRRPVIGIVVQRVVSPTQLADASQERPYVYGVAIITGFLARLGHVTYRSLPVCAALLMILGVLNVLYLKGFNVRYFWYQPALNVYSLLISFYILSRFALAAFYRPPADRNYRPAVSVVVACKNEQDSIYRTIECIFGSIYPVHLLDVIVVNDGSTDDTLAEMYRARERYPGLQVVNFAKNLGKRAGMAAGARLASGDILIYVDSDSFLEPFAVYRLVQGFADPTVGGVCGHANVQNANTNLLTKMQEVRYFVAFRVVKAAESLVAAVSCCSGCLAAYRRSYVMPILEEWLNQDFMGVSATFGDDRSLTNYMLRQYRVLYDSEAVCTTLVPDNYRIFFRQQLRWKKSWLRETLIAAGFMWRKHPAGAFFFYLGALFPLIAPLVVSNALILPLFAAGTVSWLYVYGALLMAFLYSVVYLIRFQNGLWLYGVLFALFYMMVLVWQTYYAMLTVRQNHWGTR